MTLIVDVYALGDLMGHYYVQFANNFIIYLFN